MNGRKGEVNEEKKRSEEKRRGKINEPKKYARNTAILVWTFSTASLGTVVASKRENPWEGMGVDAVCLGGETMPGEEMYDRGEEDESTLCCSDDEARREGDEELGLRTKYVSHPLTGWALSGAEWKPADKEGRGWEELHDEEDEAAASRRTVTSDNGRWSDCCGWTTRQSTLILFEGGEEMVDEDGIEDRVGDGGCFEGTEAQWG